MFGIDVNNETDKPSPVKYRVVREGAKRPIRAIHGDAGADLSYAGSEPQALYPGDSVLLPTGVAVAVPAGFVGMVCPRSGLAAAYGITVLNSPGIVDSGYRGEIMVNLVNLSSGNVGHTIQPGDRIAQLVITPYVPSTFVDVGDVTDENWNGSSFRVRLGYGSTGR